MLTTEDRLDILDLLARYNYAIDDGDAETWAACFTEDGEFVSPADQLKGAAELTQFASRPSRGTLHYTTNEIITGDGDEAAMRCYLELVNASGAKPEILFCGRYEDELAKTPAGWRFKKRTVSLATS